MNVFRPCHVFSFLISVKISLKPCEVVNDENRGRKNENHKEIGKERGPMYVRNEDIHRKHRVS